MSVYFFREYGKDGYLSNFFSTKFVMDGTEFTSSEQAFMLEKCKQFDPGNATMLTAILNEHDPKNVKKLGRQIKNFDARVWDRVRYSVMVKILLCKFSDNKTIRESLLKTKNMTLFEASPYDRIWGIGYGKSDARNISPDEYGQNLLGLALMEVREKLRHHTTGKLA